MHINNISTIIDVNMYYISGLHNGEGIKASLWPKAAAEMLWLYSEAHIIIQHNPAASAYTATWLH